MFEQLISSWSHEWISSGVVILKTMAVLALAWLCKHFLGKLIHGIAIKYHLPPTLVVPMRTLGGWVIVGAAALTALHLLGVSAPVLWTAFSGFAAVAAVAFFAAWSVLSNLFCSLLIFIAAPFRIGDRVELIDASDKPGVKGRVIAIHLLYTSLEDLTSEETRGAILQIPNSAFFQKTLRRWHAEADDFKNFHW